MHAFRSSLDGTAIGYGRYALPARLLATLNTTRQTRLAFDKANAIDILIRFELSILVVMYA